MAPQVAVSCTVPIAESLAPLPGLPPHSVMLLLLQLAVVLGVARLGAEAARRFGMPAVVGEILAGIALGPSLLGRMAPGFSAEIFPRDPLQVHLLDATGQIGMVLLLLLTGLELDLRLLRRVGRPAALASVLGMILPFGLGFGLGMVLPDGYLLDPDDRVLFSFFLATAMAISAMPVIAKILMDLRLTQRDLGIVILSACVVDDAAGWLILSVIAGAATQESVDLGALLGTLGLLAAFLLALPLLIFPIASRLLTWARTRWRTSDPALVLLMVTTFGCAALTDWIGVHPVFGAFLAGVMFRQVPHLDEATIERLESFVMGVLAPVFFATVGLKVDLGHLPGGWGIPLLVFAVACAGKLIGSAMGASWGGLSRAESLGVAIAMNARGAMGLVVATTGLGLGLLSQEMFSIIVGVAVVTSLMAPVGLRMLLPALPLSANELRSAQEARGYVVLRPTTVRTLLPTAGGTHARAAAYLAGGLSRRSSLPVELLHVVPTTISWVARVRAAFRSDGSHTEAEHRFDELARLASGEQFASRRTLVRIDPGQAILEESREFDLVVLGATTVGAPFSGPVLEKVVAAAPCHLVIVRSVGEVHGFARLLVPFDGGLLSRAAVEVAVRYCESTGASLTIVTTTSRDPPNDGFPRAPEDDLARISGVFAGSTLRPKILRHAAEGSIEALLAEIREGGHDLTLLGAENRAVEHELFFGHDIDRLIGQDDVALAVVVPNFERLAHDMAKAARGDLSPLPA